MATEYGAASLNLGFTRELCRFLSEFSYTDLPAEAVHEAKRGLIDWIGCALAGSRHGTIDTLVTVLKALGGQPQATVLGRNCKLGLLEAPIANGQMGHLLDFDDTHMGGVVLHASSPILPALFALADRDGTSGQSLIASYAAGFEAGVRVGQSAPSHHDGGWHLTGTLGSICRWCGRGPIAWTECQADDACLRDCCDPSGWHAAKSRHNVQIVSCRQGGSQWCAGGSSRRKWLR